MTTSRGLLAATLALLALAGPACADDSPYIYGIHDASGEGLLTDGGYVVESQVLQTGADPLGYLRPLVARGLTVIVRLNHGYGAQGTIPPVGPGEAYGSYQDWANALAAMTANSPHIRHWIIGNEINLPGEWPTYRSGQKLPLSIDEYWKCYSVCYDAIKRARPDALVMPTAIAPYAGDQGTGDGHSLESWTKLMQRAADNGKIDAIAMHCYTHSQDPLTASDENIMQTLPMHYNFRVYRDFLAALPARLHDKPAYITECNPDTFRDENHGWVQAIYHEIRDWNDSPGSQKVRAVCLYRWDVYDAPFQISNKPQVQQDFASVRNEKITWLSALPDLVVLQASLDTASPQPGQAVRFRAVIKNQGGSATPAGVPIGVSYSIDGAYVSYGVTTAPLAPGETRTVGTDGPAWSAAQGAHLFTAVADDVNRVQESNENNNALARTIVVNGVTSDPDAGGAFFQATGFSIAKRFEAHWNQYGGLAQFGYPIGIWQDEVSATDGKLHHVQYFERARFELHPELAAPYDVELGLLGTQFHPRDPAVAPDGTGHHFPETGHNVGQRFYDYWQAHGGLFVNGYPISEAFLEVGTDGVVHTVQYFERARYELHLDNNPPYDVLLGLLGVQAWKALGH